MKLNPIFWYHRAIREPRTRLLVILLTIAYFLFPFDISPDIFPIVGQIDDGMLLALFVGELTWLWLDKQKEQKLDNKTKNQQQKQEEQNLGKEDFVDLQFKVKK